MYFAHLIVPLQAIMATYQEYEQVKAFARIDGLLVAGVWTVSFLFAMHMGQNPMLFLASFIVGAASLVWAALRLKRFRDNILDGHISFRRAFFYSILTYLYASLLFAAVQYVYFQSDPHSPSVLLDGRDDGVLREHSRRNADEANGLLVLLFAGESPALQE